MANDTPVTTTATAPAPAQPGNGPGSRYLAGGLIFLLAVYLVAATAFALYTIIELWPHPTPAGEKTANVDKAVPKPEAAEIKARQDGLCAANDAECRTCIAREMQLQYESQQRHDPQCVDVFGCHFVLWQEKRLLLLVLLAGAVGALLHSIRYLSWFVGSRSFRASWTVYYYLSPLAGATIGFVAYIAIRGGFFSSTASTADANPFMFVALAAVSGLFSQQVLEKLKKVAESAFEPAPRTTDSATPAKPAIASLDPAKVKAGFSGPVKVTGSGFAKDATVRAAATVIKPSEVGDKLLTFELPATLTATPGKIPVVVVTGTVSSDPKEIEVEPAT